MARVLALIPDLLFGSQVQGQLRAAGYEVELIGDAERLRGRLADRGGASDSGGAGDGGGGAGDGGGGAGDGGGGAGDGGGGAADGESGDRDVLVIDLTDADLDGAALVRELTADGALAGVSTLGFFAHVEPAVRERALEAGFEMVVPRSRMAREGATLVAALSRG